MKKLASLALALILALCATGMAEHEFWVSDEPVTFTVWVQSSAEDVSQFPVIKAISEATNIYPDFIEISPAQATEQVNLMWSSKDYPDVVTGGLLTKSDVDTYSQYEAIIPLNDLIEEYNVNMKKYMTEEEFDLITSSDGNIYFYPTIQNDFIGMGLYINVEWLEALGLEKPNTPEEFKDVLIAFRDKDPNGNGIADEIPFSCEKLWSTATDTFSALMSAFGRCSGFVIENGEAIYANVMDEHKQGALWLRELYTEGLMDQEVFTQDLQEFRAKAQSDPLIFGCTIDFVASAPNRCLTNAVWDAGTYEWLLPLQAEDGVRHFIPANEYSVAYSLAITKACKNPEYVAQWVDYMYNPQISLQIDQGPVGISYDILEDGRWAMKTEAPAGYDSVYAWQEANRLQQLPRLMTRRALELGNAVLYTSPSTTTYDLQMRDKYYRENGVVCQEGLANTPALPEETEVLNRYLADIQKYYNETMANWICGNGDIEAEWDTYVQHMYDMGLQQVLDVYQAQYDRVNG